MIRRAKIIALSLLLLAGLAGFGSIALYSTGAGKVWIYDGFGLVIYGKGYWQVVWTDGETVGTNGIATNQWIFPRFGHGTNTESFRRYD